MRNLRLFINEQEVEFEKRPTITINKRETDLTDPTVARNSWTQSIQIPGTPTNERILGGLARNDRRYIPGQFNPLRRSPFKLFTDGELTQTGYAKVDKIEEKKGKRTISVTLYGGMGDFLYTCAYGDGGEKRTLADLDFGTDLDFVMDMDTLREAWDPATEDPRFSVIEFVPAYEGTPDNFSPAKMLINNNGLTAGTPFEVSVLDGLARYQPVLGNSVDQRGFSLGEAQEDLTCWETRDLRSYLAGRPAVNVRKVIEAMGDPDFNGGWELDLDEHFFNDENPYWNKAWVTLGRLTDLENTGKGESEDISGATIDSSGNVHFTASTLSSINDVRLAVRPTFTPAAQTSTDSLVCARTYKSTASSILGGIYVKNADWAGGLVVQLLAYNPDDQVVGQSKAYLFGAERDYPGTDTPLWEGFWEDGDPGTRPEYEFVQGFFSLEDGTFIFKDLDGQPVGVSFDMGHLPNDVSRLSFRMRTPWGQYMEYMAFGRYSEQQNDMATPFLYDGRYHTDNERRSRGEVEDLDKVEGSFGLEVLDFRATATDYSALFSGTRVTKDMLLGGTDSPADWLLSYCKMFDLHIYVDSGEISGDPDRYPMGVVHIMDRDTFYTGEVVDLEKGIDRESLTLVPATPQAKWYRFAQEQVDSTPESQYMDKYNRQYGSQLCDTSRDFDQETKDLYANSVFKSAIMARERDKYHKVSVAGVPPYVWNGLTYTLFHSGDDGWEGHELAVQPLSTKQFRDINTLSLPYYDATAKPVFHTEDNSASDGSGVLLFFDGYRWPERVTYWLTDDLDEMVSLNDGEACWILTNSEYDANGRRIAYALDHLPVFTRDIIPFGEEGNVTLSWDFGQPRARFVPNTWTTPDSTIYDRYWRRYMGDLYSVDNRTVKARVLMPFEHRPWMTWFRSFYWFDDSLWRLNAVEGYDMSSPSPVTCEFVRVLDPANYGITPPETYGDFVIDVPDTVPATGGTLAGTVKVQSGGGWIAGDFVRWTDSLGNTDLVETATLMTPTTGTGYTTAFVLVLPSNPGTGGTTWELTLRDDMDQPHRKTISQEANNI